MDYKEKYEEALERAKALIAKWTGKNKDFYINDYAYIFPELQDEDERIRKEIVSIVQSYRDSCISEGTHRFDDCLAWLEKQKHTAPNEYNEKMRKKIIDHLESIKMGCVICTIDTSEEIAWLEKQKAKDNYDRMAPIYSNKESFESALDKAWKFYNESGSRTVDSCEDDYVECAHAKGFREGSLFGVEMNNGALGALLTETYKSGVRDGQKQKENPKSVNSIPVDCISNAKYEDRWYKVQDSTPADGRLVLAKDNIGNYLLASFAGGEWLVERYDLDDVPMKHTYVVEWCEIPSEKQKGLDKMIVVTPEVWDNAINEAFENGKKEGEKQKEQKPAESISQLTVQGKGVYKICPRCKERMVRDDSMVYTSMPPQYRYECPKCGESECDTVMYDNPEMEEQKPVDYEAELKKCKDNPLYFYDKYVSIKLKPAEWSEEDEKTIDTIVSVLGQYIDYKAVSGTGSGYATPRYSKEIDWLKSLRPQPKRDCKDCAMFLNGKCTKPHWKPSEEQMKALLNIEGDLRAFQYNDKAKIIAELYEQLKRL